MTITPLTNTSLRDREAGTLEPVTTSVGMWKKLERLGKDSKVAIAYHTREHGFSDRPEYVLVQGDADHTPIEGADWSRDHPEEYEKFMGGPTGALMARWLSAYNWRVGIRLKVHRIVVWPDLGCEGEPEIYGAPLPDQPAPQRPPAKGTGPRLNHRRSAKRCSRLPDRLLGWAGQDGYPVVVPVTVVGTDEDGIQLELPAGVDPPPGGRRAGFIGHSFARYTFGQDQLKHTGWMEALDGRRVVYAPHTKSGYRLPESTLLFHVLSGLVTRRGVRQARRAGFLAQRA